MTYQQTLLLGRTHHAQSVFNALFTKHDVYKSIEEEGFSTYIELLEYLVANGARFNSRHMCLLMCKAYLDNYRDHKTDPFRVLCCLAMQNSSRMFDRGHYGFCPCRYQHTTPASASDWILAHWAWAPARVLDSWEKPHLQLLLSIVVHHTQEAGEITSNLLSTVLIDIMQIANIPGDIFNPRIVPGDRMCKVIEVLSLAPVFDLGVDCSAAIYAARILHGYLDSIVVFDDPARICTVHLKEEASQIVNLLEYAAAHQGSVPPDVAVYESYNCGVAGTDGRGGDFSHGLLLGRYPDTTKVGSFTTVWGHLLKFHHDPNIALARWKRFKTGARIQLWLSSLATIIYVGVALTIFCFPIHPSTYIQSKHLHRTSFRSIFTLVSTQGAASLCWLTNWVRHAAVQMLVYSVLVVYGVEMLQSRVRHYALLFAYLCGVT